MKPKHKWISVLCLVILFSFGLNFCTNPAEAQPFAYVTDFNSHTVTAIDIGTNTIAATFTGLASPTGVAVSSDGSRAYVTNRDSGDLTVIDTATQTIIASVPVGIFSLGVAVSPDGARVYVVRSNAGTVTVIDTGTNSVTTTITLGNFPAGIAITPDGTRAYVAHNLPGFFSVIDLATNTVIGTVPVPNTTLIGMAFSTDGTLLYVSNQRPGPVSVIDTGTNSVVATVPVGVPTSGVAITPDGSQVYMTKRNQHSVIAIDTATNTIAADIPTGIEPISVAVTPDGARAYVSEFHGTVSVIQTSTNAVSSTISLGGHPWQITLPIPPLVLSQTPEEAIQDVTDVLQDIVDANPGTPTADKLDDVIAKLQTALDELNKEPPDNQASVGNIEGAVGDLEATVNDGLLDFAQGSDLMDQLAGVARQLASDALDFAIDQGGDPSEINDAQQALDEGDALKASASFKDAVSKYKDALAKAESAAPASKPIVTPEPGTPATDLMLDLESLETPRVHDGIHDFAPLRFELYQNTPNPFNPSTTIRYTLAEGAKVRLSIYNVLGQEIRVLVNVVQAAGAYNAVWDGRDAFGREVSTGLYLYRLKAGTHVAVNKMVLAK